MQILMGRRIHPDTMALVANQSLVARRVPVDARHKRERKRHAVKVRGRGQNASRVVVDVVDSSRIGNLLRRRALGVLDPVDVDVVRPRDGQRVRAVVPGQHAARASYEEPRRVGHIGKDCRQNHISDCSSTSSGSITTNCNIMSPTTIIFCLGKVVSFCSVTTIQ
jgi:hypothetical protein